MMNVSKILLALGLFLCLITAPVAADDAPVLPASYYGTAAYSNGDLLPAGSIIYATVDGITSSYTLTEAGKIGAAGMFGEKFLVSGTTSGSTVTFSCGNINAGQTASFTTGGVSELALTFAVTKAEAQLSASSEAAAQFSEKPTVVAKEGATIPANMVVNVAVETASSLPATPDSVTAFKIYEVTVGNAESLNGEFSVMMPITISDTELKNSFKNNPEAVVLYHSAVTAWEKVPIIKIEKQSGKTIFYSQMSKFSPYLLGVDTSKSTISSGDSSSSGTNTGGTASSGTSTGGSAPSGTASTPVVAATQTPVPAGTQTPATSGSTASLLPSTSSVTQPTQSSPAPFAGLIAGLGAAALVLARLRR